MSVEIPETNQEGRGKVIEKKGVRLTWRRGGGKLRWDWTTG